ncbi:molecular chaperone HscC [Stenotrophomonas sp.]|uniref:molecular chaperone HscC n=1 Tax=Stenotrophomonas sp. TaxID=69392 RepID=UPI0028AB6F9A|nr:molecular chaperone HscC [Stenotrophomonas sp.]
MIVGIDLGTTHSLIGVHDGHGGRLFPNAHGELLTPSVVSLDGDTVLVGQAARERLVTHPELTAATFKRQMGTDHESTLGGRRFRPEELSALVLRSLIADAESALGEKVTEAVISVPAYFSDAQRKATRAAGELAGIRVERLINEPTAAALAYGLRDREGEGRVLVLDLGGGTFDVSLLELFDGVVEVHASAGDTFLGGEDFLEVLLQAFATDTKTDLKRLPASELARLRQQMEAFKQGLSTHGDNRLQIQLLDASMEWSCTAERFETLAAPLLQRMRLPIERALRDARLVPGDIDDVVLVGGAVRMPMVGRLATRLLGRLPLRHIHPDQAIALGATLAAGLKDRAIDLDEVVLTDVCPYTLGIDVSRVDERGRYHPGYFLPVIPRNSVVPISREQSISPVSDKQKVLSIGVYQGEHPVVERNIALGRLEIPVDPTRGGDGSFRVRFTYDVDGLLQVEITDTSNGHRHDLVLQRNESALDTAQIQTRLAALQALKVHPREHLPNVALMARAERVYAEYMDNRDHVQAWLAQFRSTLESQDTARISEQRDAFTAALDALEAES